MDGQVRVVLSETGADAERVDALTGLLRRELLDLDVADVTALTGGEPPPGARGFDALTVGGLLVSLSGSPGLLAVVHAVRRWLARGDGSPRTVRLEIDGDVLELSGATAGDQERLVGLFVGRHTAD